MSIAIGKYEPNVMHGLVLPVVRARFITKEVDGVEKQEPEEYINMELVPSHTAVYCGEETDEMKTWIENNLLLRLDDESK